ncbi:MAG: type 1 glutamine amidotransferase [Myxococcota bacterium]|nr:type 1 glutamine amidotransferase [Myxococcota bacterium]
MTKVLLIQVRAQDDGMSTHEIDCIHRRLVGRQYSLVTYNAVVHRATPTWLDGCDALIIGGSGDFSVHHPKSRPWVDPLHRVIEAALARNLPGFGICFGHQLLGEHLGAVVRTAPEHSEMGTVDIQLTDHGRQDELFSDFDSTFPVHTGHSDCVSTVPVGVDCLASNLRLSTQAFRVRGTRFYSVQFHPDMSGAEARARYLAYKEGFAERLDESALKFAERFQLERDVSTRLMGRFLDLVQLDASHGVPKK